MNRRVRYAFALMGLCALVLATAAAAGSQGKVPTVAQLVGTYRYAGDQAKQEKALAAQVAEATSDMSRIVLKRALPKLEEATRLRQRLQITKSGSNIVFESDGHRISVPIDGTQVDATTPRGERAKASFDAKSARLSLTTVGHRIDTYRINESGQLVIHVKLTNSRLTQPIAFSTAYSRTK